MGNIKELDLKKNELLGAFEKLLINNDYIILEIENYYKFIHFKVQKDLEKDIYVNISNLRKAYLPKDPTVKRRQITALEIEKIKEITEKQLSMIVAVTSVNDSYKFIGWNPFYFTGHKTNRSCYVNQFDLDNSETNVIKSKYGNTPYYIFDNNNFNEFLETFSKDN